MLPVSAGRMKAPRRYAEALMSLRGVTRFLLALAFFLSLFALRIFHYDCSPYVCARNQISLNSSSISNVDDGDAIGHSGPGAESVSKLPKMIVVASLKHENTSWLDDSLPDWKKSVYVMDDLSAGLTVAKNKGRESMAYLTYIIDNYHNLPEIMVFSHASRWQWHNEDPMYDGIPVIRNLQLPWVKDVGYANLRCTWEIGCPAQVRPARMISKIEATLEPWNERANAEAVFGRAFQELFPNTDVPNIVAIPCGGQFAVAAWKVIQRPKKDYERYKTWLMNTPLPDGVSGRVFEYSWHMIFGMDPIVCPPAGECFCQKFGLCNLDCTKSSCKGRYMYPPRTHLPDGWPEEGPGLQGLPHWGWDTEGG